MNCLEVPLQFSTYYILSSVIINFSQIMTSKMLGYFSPKQLECTRNYVVYLNPQGEKVMVTCVERGDPTTGVCECSAMWPDIVCVGIVTEWVETVKYYPPIECYGFGFPQYMPELLQVRHQYKPELLQVRHQHVSEHQHRRGKVLTQKGEVVIQHGESRRAKTQRTRVVTIARAKPEKYPHRTYHASPKKSDRRNIRDSRCRK